MVGLPRKPGPQQWVDIPLPGLEPGPARAPRELSKRDQEKAAHVSYRKYTSGASTGCQDCIDNVRGKKARSVAQATYIRIEGKEKRYLCNRHVTEWRDREQLAESRRGRS